MPLQFFTMSSASSSARGSTASGVGRTSVKRSLRRGCFAGYVEPVVQRWSAFECLKVGENQRGSNILESGTAYSMRRGRKNDDAASMTSPRRAKTNPILASWYAMRMFIGRVMVIPMPTALLMLTFNI